MMSCTIGIFPVEESEVFSENMRLGASLLLKVWNTGHFKINQKPLITAHGALVERLKNETFSLSCTGLPSSIHFANIGRANCALLQTIYVSFGGNTSRSVERL